NANPFLSPVNGALISVVVNSTSSQGPSDDGRIKPDIAGDGTNVFSTYDDNNNSYGTASGTSMASPNLTGSLLLLQEYYHQLHDVYMRAATIKGLVCHTAFDAGAVGPDPRFGYGLLDAKQSAETIAAASLAVPLAVVDELVLNQGDVYSFEVFVDNPKKLKATISWTDVPGANKNNQLNSQTPVLVNDLDLRITKNEEVNYPWKLQLSDISAPAIKGDNIVDNVEKVEVDNASGTYTIQVSHKGNLVNGPQAYSLIVTGVDSVTLSNNSIDRNLISVFPNPVNNMLNVNSDAYTFKRYDVYDFQGRLVQSGVIQEQSDFQINVSPLSSGMYILNLVSDEGVYVEKIVKK
ncbi:MAG TPA: S8 family peptidase, partial [Flavobacterium sp.]|nr:S8 family peptidase [Flavobacterium sp.]